MKNIKLKPLIKESSEFSWWAHKMPITIIKAAVRKIAKDATTGMTEQQIFELEDEILDTCFKYFKKIK